MLAFVRTPPERGTLDQLSGRRGSKVVAASVGALFASLGVTAAAAIAAKPLASPFGSGRAAPADPAFGAFWGTSADGLQAFLHVTPYGLRARIRTAAIGVKAVCISDGATGRTSERIGVNGTNILVGRDGRFSYRWTRTEGQTVTTYRLQGSFTTPKRATGTASVSTLTQGEGLSTVTCGSGTKRFTVRRR